MLGLGAKFREKINETSEKERIIVAEGPLIPIAPAFKHFAMFTIQQKLLRASQRKRNRGTLHQFHGNEIAKNKFHLFFKTP